jgi:hypothetical protein
MIHHHMRCNDAPRLGPRHDRQGALARVPETDEQLWRLWKEVVIPRVHPMI